VDGTSTDRRLPPARSRWPLTLAATLLAIAGVTFALARARATLPVVILAETELARVTREVLVQRVSGPGRLVPRHVRWLTATHRALVEQVLVQPGDRVAADSLVAIMRNPELDLALLEAERELASARIQVAATRQKLDAQADAIALELSATRERARAAKDAAARALSLRAAGVGSASEAELAESHERELVDRAALLTQQAAGAREQRSAELEPGYALVAALEKMVAHQKRELEQLSLPSGASGVVHSVTMEPGQWVEAGYLLAKVIVVDELSAELLIDELEAREVSLGQPATISLGSARLPGHVSRVDPMASRGTVNVEIVLDPLEPGLRADQRVSGEIEVRRYPEALSLKAPLQVTRAGHFSLYKRADAETLLRVDAELTPATAGRVLVRSGLAEGDEVVIEDLARFKEHDRLALR
jgi:HlyD family secretion protein